MTKLPPPRFNWLLHFWLFNNPRVEGWLFMSSILPVLCVVGLALGLLKYGPIFMENRKPFQLTRLFSLYNIVLVYLNIHIFIKYLVGALRLNYNWICDAPDPTNVNEDEMQIVKMTHLFLVVKVLELFDFVFQILRKKSMAKANILVFHHSFMAIISWIGTRWIPSGSIFVPPMFASLVHAILYFYFGLTVWAPKLSQNPHLKTFIKYFSSGQAIILFSFGLYLIYAQCKHMFILTYTFAIFMPIIIYNMYFPNIKSK